MAGARTIDIQVVYALPARHRLIALRVDADTTVAESVRRSGLLAEFPEIDLGSARLGIFGRRVPHDHVVAEGDRVEVYRPLTADPKAVRRERAERAKVGGQFKHR